MTNYWGNPSEVWAQLEGAWRLERHISSGETLNGLAQFTKDKSILFYREEGDFCLPTGQCFQAFRSYLYTPQPQGFAVYFDETPLRLFQEIALNAESMTGTAIHLCGQDTYRSVYSFREKDSFVVEHNVWGARKNYRMISTYTRT